MSNETAKILPDEFRRIRLELAREKGHPEGDSEIGYTLLAPLTSDGHLDADQARKFKTDCKVIRYRRDEDAEEGYLKRGPGGVWGFQYDFDNSAEDDDPAFRLDRHRFAIGDYITLMEDEGEHTYRVARVDPL